MAALVPPVADEREGLVGYLAQQRYVLRIAAYGLTDEQARLRPTRSALSIGGLVKHEGLMERQWQRVLLQQPRVEQDWSTAFTLAPDETLAWALDEYEAAAKDTDAIVAGFDDLGTPIPVPRDSPWFPKEIHNWSVRWVLLHLIEETARHAGHADIIREAIDGATAFPLLAAAEGWPATPWITPWTPGDQAADG